MASDQKHDAFIAQFVRTRDLERYLSVLYAPKDKQSALMALHAFDLEILAIRDKISQPLPGEIRLQWWRDLVIGNQTSAASGNPIGESFLHALEANGISGAMFDSYFEARIFDFYDDPMPTRNDVEGYCGEVYGTLIQAALHILGAKELAPLGEMAGHGACAYGINAMIRDLSKHRARAQCYIPAEFLAFGGLDSESYFQPIESHTAQHTIEAMIALAREHYSAFLQGAKELPKQLRPAVLMLAPVQAHLKVFEKEGTKTFEQRREINPLVSNWVILKTALMGF